MMAPLADRSLRRLEGVHPRLVEVVLLAAATSPMNFIVTDGVRTLERQIELVKEGKSKTLRSRHLGPVGHAVDLAVILEDGTVSWENSLYKLLAMTMKEAARQLAVPIEWGGEAFGSFYDGPHFQLPWKEFPLDVPNLNPAGQVTKT